MTMMPTSDTRGSGGITPSDDNDDNDDKPHPPEALSSLSSLGRIAETAGPDSLASLSSLSRPHEPPAPAYDPFPAFEPSAELLAELVEVERRMPQAIAAQLAAALDPDGRRGIDGRMVKRMQKFIEEMPDDFEETAA